VLVEAARQGGLKADDLVLRSTLLGEGRSATLMTSMERTRQLEMNPDLAAKLEGNSAPGGTKIIDADPESNVPTATPTGDAPPQTATSAAAASPSSSGEAIPTGGDPTGPEPSRVDPTLADHPADDVHEQVRRSRSGESIPDTGSVSDTDSTGSVPDTGCVPNAAWEPPRERGGPAGRRLAVIALCFIAGASLALFAALRLGVFDDPEPGVDSYARRARVALAASAYGAPPGENVRDITDSALAKWPGDATILEVRRDAAHRLVVRAQLMADDDAAEAERLATLALQLDPQNADAGRILAGDGRTPVADVPDAPAASPPSASVAPAQPRSTTRRTPPPATSAQPDAGEAEEDASEDGEPPKQGGRWL
jgi:hypothetical protein